MSTFIVLEGPDGSGSSTQAAILFKHMQTQGIDCIHTNQPSTGKIGTVIRQFLFEKPLPHPTAFQLMYTADRADHVETVIKPALASGQTVLCERYTLSTELYTAATGGDVALLTQVNSAFLKPDLTIILLPPFKVCMERINQRTKIDELEKYEFQEKLYTLYKAIDAPNTYFIDSSGSIEDTATQIWECVLKVL